MRSCRMCEYFETYIHHSGGRKNVKCERRGHVSILAQKNIEHTDDLECWAEHRVAFRCGYYKQNGYQYTPVNIEDVTEGWYFLRDKEGEVAYMPVKVTGEGQDATYESYTTHESYAGDPWEDLSVSDWVKKGGALYRIPDLEVAE